MSMIPILQPKLPSAERLVPYLRKIDSSRIYSNYGPLAVSFEDRLAAHFDLPQGTVTTVANATLGLTLGLAAQGARPGTLCAMPAWTFIASAHAATLAGLTPYFVDVDPSTWTIDPDEIADLLPRAPGVIGAVMPVLPFGRPIDVAAWDRFRSRTGLPVVIDAAAGFDAVTASATPAVVSLHATKVLGVGEGGFIMSTDTSIIREIRARANFGFRGTREAATAAVNAKLSEYHAAVGHAALDEWTETRAEWMALAQIYRRTITESNRLRFQEGFGHTWITATCVLSLADSAATRMEQALAAAGIDTRRWWGEGAHAHPATSAFPRGPLPTAEALARSTIAVPFFRDLQAADVQRVADHVLASIAP